MFYHAFLLCVLVDYIACKSDVLHLNTYDARVYASSTAPGSDPQYAVDHDFNASTPTCFQSSTNQTDSNGFHWLIMDLGAITLGITEIRLTLGAEKNAFGVENIDVFTATYLHTNQIHQATQSTHVVDLPWDMFEFCNNTSNEFLTPYGAVVRCSPAKSGKWIILRRKTKSLYICLLAVYVESTSHECFDEVAVSPDGSPAVSPGSVFRLERHVTHGQCRESCMETPVCQAISFVHRPRTGMCYLLQQFNQTDDSSSVYATFMCMHGSKCKIEENICHRGRIFPLVQAEGENTRRWKIQVPSTLPEDALEIRNLYAVQMKGKAVCKSANCDLLEISVTDEFGETFTCTRLDLTVITVLDKLPAYCERPENQSKVSFVVLQLITSEGYAVEQNNTELDLEGGYVQLLDNTRPAALIREVPTMPKMLDILEHDLENQTGKYELEASTETLAHTEATTSGEPSFTSTEATLRHTTPFDVQSNEIDGYIVANQTDLPVDEHKQNGPYTTEQNRSRNTTATSESPTNFNDGTENYEQKAADEAFSDTEEKVKSEYMSTSTATADAHDPPRYFNHDVTEENVESNTTTHFADQDARTDFFTTEQNENAVMDKVNETKSDLMKQNEISEHTTVNEGLPNKELMTSDVPPYTATQATILLTHSADFKADLTEEDMASDSPRLWVPQGTQNNTNAPTTNANIDTAAKYYPIKPISIAGIKLDLYTLIIIISVVSSLIILLAILMIWACCTCSKKRAGSK